MKYHYFGPQCACIVRCRINNRQVTAITFNTQSVSNVFAGSNKEKTCPNSIKWILKRSLKGKASKIAEYLSGRSIQLKAYFLGFLSKVLFTFLGENNFLLLVYPTAQTTSLVRINLLYSWNDRNTPRIKENSIWANRCHINSFVTPSLKM